MYDFGKVRDVADYLAKMDGEEYNRSAISRYYYSLFGSVRLYLILVLDETNFAKGKNVHGRVCDRLTGSNDSTEKSLGKILDKLRGLRNLADYDWYQEDSLFFEENVHIACEVSRKGLEQLESLKKSPPFKL